MLVERTRLAPVLETGLVLDHAVPELVADHVQRAGEGEEQLAVAVAEDHPPAVPERVVVLLAEVHDAAQRHVLVVDRLAAEDVQPERVRVAEAVVGAVDVRVALRRLALAPHDRDPRDLPAALGVADDAVRNRRRGGAGECVGTFARASGAGLGIGQPRGTNPVVRDSACEPPTRAADRYREAPVGRTSRAG